MTVKDTYFPLRILCLVFLLIVFSGCGPGDAEIDEMYVLQYKGADMPVWVRGSADMNALVVILHGGPGGSALDYIIFDTNWEEELESRYLLAYWEQRGSGNTQGNYDESTVTVEQFADDLKMVVLMLKKEFPEVPVFLMGHSFGGALGTLYLLDDERESLVDGWIEVDGSHNVNLEWELMRLWVMDNVDNTSDSALRGEIITWCDEHTVIDTLEEKNSLWSYMIELGGQDNYTYAGAGIDEFGAYYFNSPANPLYAWVNGLAMTQIDDNDEYVTDYSDRMYQITVPTAILWGIHDGICPVGMAQDAYDHLGTSSDDKRMILFDQSAHSPMLDEPVKFTEEVVQFIEDYR